MKEHKKRCKFDTKEELRGDQFATRTVTKIWKEIPSEQNPYLAENCRCHGYDLMQLMRKKTFPEVLFLLFQGEFPSREQIELLEGLMIGLINLGPRHPATRAGMNAAVANTNSALVLPITLALLRGEFSGGPEVKACMKFLCKNQKNDPRETVDQLFAEANAPKEGDWHIAPGFGTRFGGIEPMTKKIAEHLASLDGARKILKWGCEFSNALEQKNMGWLVTGVAAAAFCDLGFNPNIGPGLFQLIVAPGLLAHGVEMLGKPITAMPFLDQEHYIIDPQAKKLKEEI